MCVCVFYSAYKDAYKDYVWAKFDLHLSKYHVFCAHYTPETFLAAEMPWGWTNSWSFWASRRRARGCRLGQLAFFDAVVVAVLSYMHTSILFNVLNYLWYLHFYTYHIYHITCFRIIMAESGISQSLISKAIPQSALHGRWRTRDFHLTKAAVGKEAIRAGKCL